MRNKGVNSYGNASRSLLNNPGGNRMTDDVKTGDVKVENALPIMMFFARKMAARESRPRCDQSPFWKSRRKSGMSGQISSLSNLGIAADLELTKVVDIAGHVGDISGDDVNVSYTSLLIGLLWSDDPTSQWLQTQLQQHSVRIDEIYSHRNHPERSRDVILRRVSTGTEYLPRKDVISVS